MRQAVMWVLAVALLVVAGMQMTFHGMVIGKSRQGADSDVNCAKGAAKMMEKMDALYKDAERQQLQAERMLRELQDLQRRVRGGGVGSLGGSGSTEVDAGGDKASGGEADSRQQQQGQGQEQQQSDPPPTPGLLYDDATKISTISLEEAIRMHREKLNTSVEETCHTNPDYQSSRHFVDFDGPGRGGWAVPHADGDGAGRGRCDSKNFDPTHADRTACQEFMMDLRNWRYLRPMNSHIYTGRTIKFAVETVDPGVVFIMKIPQRKFVLEPHSEYAAYLVDKEMELGRVPTVAFLPVPIDWLRAASAVFMPAMYNQWIDCFVFQEPQLQEDLLKWDGTNVGLYVSIQIFMEGVKLLGDTPLHVLVDKGGDVDDALDPTAQYQPLSKLEAWALQEASDLYVFDEIIGNSDRGDTFEENHNVFAVGDCRTPPWGCKGKAGTVYPRMVYLDQGSAFYSSKRAKNSHFGKDSALCKFSARMVRTLTTGPDGDALKARVLEQLPEMVFEHQFSRRAFDAAFKRVDALRRRVRECKKRFGTKGVVMDVK